MIDDIHTYYIEVRGPVTQEDLNAASPVRLDVVQAAESRAVFSACTDQSGLIGLLRHLHGMGILLLSVSVDQLPASSQKALENQ